MKPTGFADLKTKTRQSLKVLDPQNAGSRLHPKLWDWSSANSHKAQLCLDKHLKKKFPLSERTLKFYKLLGLNEFETWSPLLTKKLELKKDFPLLTFSEMERLLGRTLNWEQPSRKLIQRNFEFLENVTSFTDSGLNAKKFSKPFSTNVGVERDFHFLPPLRWKSCCSLSKAIDWRQLDFLLHLKIQKTFEICSKSTRQNNFCVFHKNLPT